MRLLQSQRLRDQRERCGLCHRTAVTMIADVNLCRRHKKLVREIERSTAARQAAGKGTCGRNGGALSSTAQYPTAAEMIRAEGFTFYDSSSHVG